MSRVRCSIVGCRENRFLHKLPQDKAVREQWLRFIFSEVPPENTLVNNLMVCSAHFTPDCFGNLAQFNAGFSTRLRIKDTAVPTLQSQALPPIPTITHQHIGAQTDPPSLASVGTQLSLKTLGPTVRSKGTQTCESDLIAGATSFTAFLSATDSPRPRKRQRVELSEEEDITAPYSPTSNFEECASVDIRPSQHLPCTKSGHNERKYIVHESCLLELFEKCPVCTEVCEVTPRTRGTFLAISQCCPHCQYSRQWKSQPVLGSTPAGNLQLSAAIYFSGVSFYQIEKIFKAVDLQMFKYNSFKKNVQLYLEPTVMHKWKKDRDSLVQQVSQDDRIIIGGDMRGGSSGKCGSYSALHLESNTIVDIQMVLSNDVKDSNHMELEGLKRSLEQLAESGITLDYIVNDRLPQVQKYLKDGNIKQFHDIWDVEKGLSKNLNQLAEERDYQVVQEWQHIIKHHVNWSAASSESGPEKEAMWKALANQLLDVHSHDDPLLPKCENPVRTPTDQNRWLQPGSKSLYKVEKASAGRAQEDVERHLSPHHQTSSLEAFHRVTLRFAPKNVLFSYIGMLCRLYLAAMYFNENTNLPQAASTSGQLMYNMKSHMAEKCPAKPSKTKGTYGYIQELMDILFEEVCGGSTPYEEEVWGTPVPEPLSCQYISVSVKEEETDAACSTLIEGLV